MACVYWMYNLLLVQLTTRISSNCVLFIPPKIIMQRSLRLCSFCNFYHGKVSKLMHHQIRTNATTANSLGRSSIKKRVRQKKLYAELLEVTPGKSSNKKTSIQKIKGSNITMLVDNHDDILQKSPDIANLALNEISGLNICDENSTSPNNEDNASTGSDISILPETSNHNKDSYNNKNTPEKSENVQFTNKENKRCFSSKMKSQKQPENHKHKINNKYASKRYIENLLAHMQVYLSCKMMNRVNKTLMRYRKVMLSNLKYSSECVELYNIVLEAYAFRKDLPKVLDLYEIIKNDSVQPTAQTYVYMFDAMERSNTKKNQLDSDLFQKLIKEMSIHGITLNDMFNKTHFKHNQRENVLKVIRLHEPNFEPSRSIVDLGYTCNLLNKVPMRDNYCSPAEDILTMDELTNDLKVQLQREEDIEVPIESINKPQRDINIIFEYRGKVAELENYWKEVALVAFERNLKCLKEQERHSFNSLMVLHPFLEVLDKEHYLNAIIREVRKVANGSETFSMALNLLHIDIGMNIYKKYEIQSKERNGVLDKIVKIYQKYLKWYLHPKSVERFANMNNRTVWQYFEGQEESIGTSLNTMCYTWPKDVIANVGKFLYNIILNDLILKPDLFKGHEVKSSIPAFYTLFRHKETYLIEQIKPHPIVSKMYKEAQSDTLSFNSIFIPSNAPPRPWTSVHTGGYLLTSTDFVRIINGTDSLWQKLQNTPVQQLYPAFDSLNQLSSIPWTINSPILDIVIEIFQQGGSVELSVPQSVSMLIPPSRLQENATAQEKRKIAIEMAKFKQKKYEVYSLWCDALYRLSLANHFRDKVFWLPHNLDFRGRVYPIPPHLNHLASDLSRSLLLFAKSKPLGPKGLDWLKLHVINLTSKKKGSSVQERLEFANENLDIILDSAKKPLTGKMWWKQSEEPWQTLAGCMEIANALKAPNIEEYESRFPIHQDGSCNGLQHYAALGRDQIGAESVNLYPFHTPKDVYTTVADLIEENRQIDVKNEVKIAKLLDGFVKRKVIKQTVMTTVYGVTKYGAKLQITKQLKDMAEFPEEHVWPAGSYLTEKTFSTLRTMFKSAREIQDWFTSCARIISSVCCEEVEWVTPLGLPIIQPYVKQLKKSDNNHKPNEKPDSMKQKNAFAPNFIHSLDSTHMMLTSIHCKEAGITFVSVHDCFWTHASTVDIMNKICREQFVALHTEPILEDLAKFFVNRYKQAYINVQPEHKITPEEMHRILTSVPSKGKFDINNVLSSTYFFS
ncbi:mitochondrial RNA polymerase [Lasioglossum baleicum]|uniref:mitochondrial RNA polymerase n=1 Tax=Lasioglossum baleicum TaxID=434251 RepID=UPI003FCDDFC5